MEDKKKPEISRTVLFVLTALLAFTAGGLVVFFFLKAQPADAPHPLLKEDTAALDSEAVLHAEEEEKEAPPPKIDNKAKNQEESIVRYKKMLEKTVESETFKETPQEYIISIGDYEHPDQAMEVSIDLKAKHKNKINTLLEDWDIRIHEVKGRYKVILIGFFVAETSAQKFLDQMPKTTLFLSAKVLPLSSIQ